MSINQIVTKVRAAVLKAALILNIKLSVVIPEFKVFIITFIDIRSIQPLPLLQR